MEYRFYLYHQDNGRYLPIADPQGWDSLERNIKRFGFDGSASGPWHGIFFDYSTKLKFVKDGKNFVQGFFEKYGIEQDILLRIDRRNLRTRVFETYYEGRLNLHTYKSTTITVECNVEQTGFIQKLKNGGEIKNEVAHSHTIALHSKVLRKVSKTSRLEVPDFTPDRFPSPEETLIAHDPPGLTTTTHFLIPSFVTELNEFVEPFNYPDQYQETSVEDDLKYVLKPVIEFGDLSVRNKFRVRIFGDNNTPMGSYAAVIDLSITITRKRAGVVTTYTCPVYALTATVTPGEYDSGFLNIDCTELIPFIKDDEIYWYFTLETNITQNYLQFDLTADNFVSYSADTLTDPTDCRVVLIHEALASVVESVTGLSASFYSDYYGRTDLGYAADGAGSLRAITNVNQIRGIDKPIRCTFKDLVTTTWTLDAIGIGIEKVDGVERVRVEPLTYWYQTKRLMRLNYILDIEKGVLAELYYNQIDGGTDKWSNEKVTNLDEFNASREWTLPITQVKNKLDVRCPYITSGFTIEFARRENQQPTKDTPRDDENVIIRLVRDGGNFIPEKDEAFITVTNVISPETSYNLQDSPARCLRRHGRLLRSFLEKQKEQYIRFSFGAANTLMESRLTTEATFVLEDNDILISDLERPLFLAEVYSVRARLTYEQLVALQETDPDADENVWGFIEFSQTDRDWKRGYLLDARQAADSNEVILQLIKANI